MINPPPLPERVEPTVCLIKPKGRDRAGHTARERGRQRQIGKRRKKKLFSSLLLSGCHRSTGRDSSSWLPAPCVSSRSSLSIVFHFLPMIRKNVLSASLSLSPPFRTLPLTDVVYSFFHFLPFITPFALPLSLISPCAPSHSLLSPWKQLTSFL